MMQMLPWENVPILRNQEVYRMPSIWSISAILNRNFHNQEQARTYPLIDPLHAFYLLNPGGDLSDTQAEFEKWFKDQNLEVISHICLYFSMQGKCFSKHINMTFL